MEQLVSTIEKCRVCGNSSLIPCASIGAQYLSSVFPANLDYREEVPRLPLDLVMCEKKEDGTTCGLVQLGHKIDLRAMYDAYPYSSATNSSMSGILKDVADSGKALKHLRSGDLILDIGGNDGTLLSYYQTNNYELLCIDAAKNVVPRVNSDRYTHIRDFFSADLYASATNKKAKLIFSVAMFYHLADPINFSRDVAKCLADDGVWIIQMVYLPTMLRTNMYDNIVHEHCGYYATHHMQWIMEMVGLEIFDVELNDVYGGSFRVFVKKKGCNKFPQTQRYHANLREELELGIFEHATYRAFMRRVEQTRADLRVLCRKVREEGKTIWVYGASTKGNTILQYCGLGKDDIVAAADANPFKLGKYILGADIPIKDEATMRAARPDYLLALPYSFVEAFMKREAELVAKGTKFIVPLPQVRIIP
jgi:NDP-4-keto-2,6-dideoxyhexose 3-C-methyltransferase